MVHHISFLTQKYGENDGQKKNLHSHNQVFYVGVQVPSAQFLATLLSWALVIQHLKEM